MDVHPDLPPLRLGWGLGSTLHPMDEMRRAECLERFIELPEG
jgi:hypothetical protein